MLNFKLRQMIFWTSCINNKWSKILIQSLQFAALTRKQKLRVPPQRIHLKLGQQKFPLVAYASNTIVGWYKNQIKKRYSPFLMGAYCHYPPRVLCKMHLDVISLFLDHPNRVEPAAMNKLITLISLQTSAVSGYSCTSRCSSKHLPLGQCLGNFAQLVPICSLANFCSYLQ